MLIHQDIVVELGSACTCDPKTKAAKSCVYLTDIYHEADIVLMLAEEQMSDVRLPRKVQFADHPAVHANGTANAGQEVPSVATPQSTSPSQPPMQVRAHALGLPVMPAPARHALLCSCQSHPVA